MPLDISDFYRVVNAFPAMKPTVFTSFSGSSNALLYTLLLRQGRNASAPAKPLVLLCASESSAGEFYSDSVFWSEAVGTERPLFIRSAEDPLRMKNLRELYGSGVKGFIASAEAVLSPVWGTDTYPLVRIAKGSVLERESLIETLKRFGYTSVPLVSGQGETSARGGILDVFPPEEDLPVRIEFYGDEIESLRSFDIDTQRTVKELDEISIGNAVEPEKGPSLIEVFGESTFILNERDDVIRRCPGVIPLLEGKDVFHITSLPLKGEGVSLDIRGVGGLGLLREERDTLEDFVSRAHILSKDHFISMVCSSDGQAKRLRDLFLEKDLEVPVLESGSSMIHGGSLAITKGVLSRGFMHRNSIILSERDIFGEKPRFKAIKRSKVAGLVSSIEDFREGDYLVHSEHGIGKFLGLKKQKIEGLEGDFIVMEYQGSDRLYVPLERINTIRKYHAPESARPRMDKLGGRTWQRTRNRVKQKIKDMAEKLLSLYARRSTAPGHVFSEDTELHREFDGFFLYEETPDQSSAIAEIKKDLEKPAPMERLLCGDAGYGKTEVVMRACFKAAYDSKQVAVLVPTTILAEQHYETFTERFSAFPIRIDYLSRFKSRAEQKKTIDALSRGDIDIVIGTHRLLAKDVHFHDLGLLVIDEEHRFGVTHKEKLKSLKTNVSVLTLSATPIPRTLHMALSGIRSMSVIETPPEDRLAVRSFVARFDPQVIADALHKELERGGQAFFVHNRIQDIYRIARFLMKLLPGASIAVAHGQMREKELEQVMRSFLHKETSILVSTAIIGSGLDIPSANTIIINRADRFGLADLYQLRGRVGRSNVRAYAYFLIPGEDIITEEARKKLQALQEMSYLGAGFRLAMRDLEIRGAGNLLGAEQSGHIEAVGFDLYLEMLEQAVSELRGEKVAVRAEPALNLRITASIPESYIENPDIRLSLYRKVASAKDRNSLNDIRDELADRFGPLPGETNRLLEVMELKVLARKLSVLKIDNVGGMVRILFSAGTGVKTGQVLSLYEQKKQCLRLLPEGGMELDLRERQWDAVFGELKETLEYLAT